MTLYITFLTIATAVCWAGYFGLRAYVRNLPPEISRKPLLGILGLLLVATVLVGLLLLLPKPAHAFWDTPTPSDKAANAAQEKMLREAHSAIGLPTIRNFREKRLLKMIYELRDQDGLRTYTHIVAQQTAKPFLLCNSIGYPISDATGYTSPDKVVRDNGTAFGTVTQAEPNGLFTPDTSDGYWVMCLDPKAGKATPTFVTGQVIVTTFPLP